MVMRTTVLFEIVDVMKELQENDENSEFLLLDWWKIQRDLFIRSLKDDTDKR